MKKIIIACFVALSITACKKEAVEATDTTNKYFAELLASYSEEGFVLNPVSATSAGDNRFNDQFPNYLSDEYTKKLKAYYTRYKIALEAINDDDLTATEKMSKAVLQWDCNINLEAFNFKKDLLPIDQMWSSNLDFNQLAGGTNAQPFKTVQDYSNWLKRVDAYLIWLNAAKENMKKGMTKGYVLPTSLIVKVIPQFEGLASGDIKDHLYYGPAKNIPDSFSDNEKKSIISTYSDMPGFPRY